MYADWNQSSNGLPREGQEIEFVLDHRSVAMKGTYDHQVFHSNWAQYTVDRVRSWRDVAQEFDQAIPTPNRAARVLSNAPSRGISHDPLPAGGFAHAA